MSYVIGSIKFRLIAICQKSLTVLKLKSSAPQLADRLSVKCEISYRLTLFMRKSSACDK